MIVAIVDVVVVLVVIAMVVCVGLPALDSGLGSGPGCGSLALTNGNRHMDRQRMQNL